MKLYGVGLVLVAQTQRDEAVGCCWPVVGFALCSVTGV